MSRQSNIARVQGGDVARRQALSQTEDGKLLKWIAVQRKAFTSWANVLLSQRMLAIDNLEEDLRDGNILVHLLEILTDTTIVKKKQTNPSRIQSLQTVTIALDFLDSLGIRTQGISSFEIVEGNLKISLGLMWALVCFYQIQEGGKRSVLQGKRALLLWVKNQVKSYDLTVANFSSSFADGKVLSALIDCLLPGELNMKKAMNGIDAERTLERAMDIAETSLDIPRILEPVDFLDGKPDDLAVMTYVSFFRMKWNKPRLTKNQTEAQKSLLQQPPERHAPSGTIRRLMQELESDNVEPVDDAADVKPVEVPQEIENEGQHIEQLSEIEAKTESSNDDNDNSTSQYASLMAVRDAHQIDVDAKQAQKAREQQEKDEKEQQEKEELAAKQRAEERQREQAARQAELQREREAEEAARAESRVKEENEQKAREEAEAAARAESRVKEENERQAREEAEAKALAEAEAKAKEEAEKQANDSVVVDGTSDKQDTVAADDDDLDDEMMALLQAGESELEARRAAEAAQTATVDSTVDNEVNEEKVTPPGTPPSTPPPQPEEKEPKPVEETPSIEEKPTSPTTTKSKRPKICEVCKKGKVAAKFKSTTPGAAQYVCKPCAIDISRKSQSVKTKADEKPKARPKTTQLSVDSFNSSSLRVGKGKSAAFKSSAKRKQRHSVIVQLPSRPEEQRAPPTPSNAPPRATSEQKTGTMGTLDSAQLMSQVQKMLAEEGLDMELDDGKSAPALPKTAPPSVSSAPSVPDDDESTEEEDVAQRRIEQVLRNKTMWFYADLTEQGAVQRLNSQPDGSFLVRPATGDNVLCLSSKQHDKVVHEKLIFNVVEQVWRRQGNENESSKLLVDLLKKDNRLQFEATHDRVVSQDGNVDEDNIDSDDDSDEIAVVTKVYGTDKTNESTRQSVRLTDNATVGEAALRTLAQTGVDTPAPTKESGEVRSELPDGSREIEIELADMATYVAIAPYDSQQENELSFEEGQEVIVLGPDDSGWWKAELNGTFGWVPAAFFVKAEQEAKQPAPELVDEGEVVSLVGKEAKAALSDSPIAPTSAQTAAAPTATDTDEPTLAEDGEVVYCQAIEDFVAEGEGELGFRRDDYVCVLKVDDMEAGGWWKGQLPTGEFGWVPGEFLDILPKKPEDWANRQPANKNRLTVKVDGLLSGNVQHQIREMEAIVARWGMVASKHGKLWTRDSKSENGEWQQRFCVLLAEQRCLLELTSWRDEPGAALARHYVSSSIHGAHQARAFAFFLRTKKSSVLLAPIAADKEAKVERDEWLAALQEATKSSLKTKESSSKSKRHKKSSASAVAKAAAIEGDVVLQGKLQKKSLKWSSRWFVLTANGKLLWWDSSKSATAGKKPKGSLSLAEARVQLPSQSKHFSFTIKTRQASMLLKASTATSQHEWAKAIQDVVAKL